MAALISEAFQRGASAARPIDSVPRYSSPAPIGTSSPDPSPYVSSRRVSDGGVSMDSSFMLHVCCRSTTTCPRRAHCPRISSVTWRRSSSMPGTSDPAAITSTVATSIASTMARDSSLDRSCTPSPGRTLSMARRAWVTIRTCSP